MASKRSLCFFSQPLLSYICSLMAAQQKRDLLHTELFIGKRTHIDGATRELCEPTKSSLVNGLSLTLGFARRVHPDTGESRASEQANIDLRQINQPTQTTDPPRPTERNQPTQLTHSLALRNLRSKTGKCSGRSNSLLPAPTIIFCCITLVFSGTHLPYLLTFRVTLSRGLNGCVYNIEHCHTTPPTLS